MKKNNKRIRKNRESVPIFKASTHTHTHNRLLDENEYNSVFMPMKFGLKI